MFCRQPPLPALTITRVTAQSGSLQLSSKKGPPTISMLASLIGGIVSIFPSLFSTEVPTQAFGFPLHMLALNRCQEKGFGTRSTGDPTK